MWWLGVVWLGCRCGGSLRDVRWLGCRCSGRHGLVGGCKVACGVSLQDVRWLGCRCSGSSGWLVWLKVAWEKGYSRQNR